MWLRKALKSLLYQSKKANEIILIIDGDIDKLLEKVVEEFKLVLPLKDYRNKNNMGLAYSLNKGLDIVECKYIARIDANDVAHPTRLAVQKEYLDQ